MRRALVLGLLLALVTVTWPGQAAPAPTLEDDAIAYGHLGTLAGLDEASARAFLAEDPRLDGVDLRFEGIREGLTLRHARFVQVVDGLPVEGTRAQVSVDDDGIVRWTIVDVEQGLDAAACFGMRDAALAEARAAFPGDLWIPLQPRHAEHLVTHEGDLVWRVNVLPKEPLGSWMVEVDCDGDVVRTYDAARYHGEAGTVYPVNPLVAAADPDLRDTPAGTGALWSDLTVEVDLLGLDESGFLNGEYVYMVTPTANGNDAQAFTYDRAAPQFEEVMAYYYTDFAQRHIQSLGFDDIHNRTTATVPRVPGAYTAFYTGNPDAEIFYGWHGVGITLLYGVEHIQTDAPTGLADAAEDAHVIFHEYGHAVLDDQAGICCTEESGAMHEAFGDWQAASLSTRFHNVTDADGCMAPWFGSYLNSLPNGEWPCYRNLVNDKTMDDWTEGDDAHFNQLIWSGALWEIETALMADMGREEGAAEFERLMYEMNFLLPQEVTFKDAILGLMQADALQNDGSNLALIEGVFVTRKFVTAEELPGLAELLPEGAGEEVLDGADVDQLAVPGVGVVGLLAGLAVAVAARRR